MHLGLRRYPFNRRRGVLQNSSDTNGEKIRCLVSAGNRTTIAGLCVVTFEKLTGCTTSFSLLAVTELSLVTVTLKLELTDQGTLLSPPSGASPPVPPATPTRIWERVEQHLHRHYVVRGVMETLPYLKMNYSKSKISEFTMWTTACIFREREQLCRH
jgi:hypothetical protein